MMVIMMMKRKQQHGFLLVEVMIAALIFVLGILGLVAMSGTAIGSQSDARFRNDAARFADQIASTMAVSVNRDPLLFAASLAAFNHNVGGAACPFGGAPSALPAVTLWDGTVVAAGTGLPNASTQIVVNAGVGGFNQVNITVCWQAPSDTAMRRHTLVTYVN